ncbi:MAG: hypothetical protein ACYDHP_08860 [Ferrimicrobium sp.]
MAEAPLKASAMPVSPQFDRVVGYYDKVSGALDYLLVASGTQVGFVRLIRLD